MDGELTGWRLAAAKARYTTAEIAAISRAVGGRLQRRVGRAMHTHVWTPSGSPQ
jgi:hypothetical protein